jgi:hypothetical protein
VATLGIVGGLGPESTIDYYRRIVEEWRRHHPSSFAGPFRYTRVWRARDDGWRIVAGHVSAIAP